MAAPSLARSPATGCPRARTQSSRSGTNCSTSARKTSSLSQSTSRSAWSSAASSTSRTTGSPSSPVPRARRRHRARPRRSPLARRLELELDLARMLDEPVRHAASPGRGRESAPRSGEQVARPQPQGGVVRSGLQHHVLVIDHAAVDENAICSARRRVGRHRARTRGSAARVPSRRASSPLSPSSREQCAPCGDRAAPRREAQHARSPRACPSTTVLATASGAIPSARASHLPSACACEPATRTRRRRSRAASLPVRRSWECFKTFSPWSSRRIRTIAYSRSSHSPTLTSAAPERGKRSA